MEQDASEVLPLTACGLPANGIKSMENWPQRRKECRLKIKSGALKLTHRAQEPKMGNFK